MAALNALYPATVSVRRPNVAHGNNATSVGDQGFAGDDSVTAETAVLSNIPANISFKSKDYRNPTDLPTDSRGTIWLITIPVTSAARGTILVGDIIVDDLKARYRVAAPDWQILGYQLLAEMLNT